MEERWSGLRTRGCRTNEENLLLSLDKTFDCACGYLLLTTSRGATDFEKVSGFEAAIKELVKERARG